MTRSIAEQVEEALRDYCGPGLELRSLNYQSHSVAKNPKDLL